MANGSVDQELRFFFSWYSISWNYNEVKKCEKYEIQIQNKIPILS